MNIFFKTIQKSFDLLDQPGTKQSYFITALDCMLKIADESEYETETCTIHSDQKGNIVIVLTSKEATLTITADHNGISYTGTGPKKEDQIHIINTKSYSAKNLIKQLIKIMFF